MMIESADANCLQGNQQYQVGRVVLVDIADLRGEFNWKSLKYVGRYVMEFLPLVLSFFSFK